MAARCCYLCGQVSGGCRRKTLHSAVPKFHTICRWDSRWHGTLGKFDECVYDEAVSADLSGYAAGSLEQAETRPAFIEIDLKNAFNSHSRQAAFDTLAGKATKDYVGAGVLSGEALPHLAELQKFFPYVCNMYDSAATLRFYDSTGQVHHIPGTTGSQQGDSAAMLNFSHVTHPLWGGIMGQYPSARAAAYADDGFVRDTLLTVLRILAALKHAFKEDLGMELTLPKCKVLIPGLSQEDANDAIRSVISSHAELSSLQDMVSDEALARHSVGDRPMTIQDVVKVDGLTCVGVPIGTPAFMRDWAGVKLRDQIQDLCVMRASPILITPSPRRSSPRASVNGGVSGPTRQWRGIAPPCNCLIIGGGWALLLPARQALPLSTLPRPALSAGLAACATPLSGSRMTCLAPTLGRLRH